MGPALVATMVQNVGEPTAKKLHPFFTKGPATELAKPTDAGVSDPETSNEIDNVSVPEESDGRRKRRKRNDPSAQDENGQKRQRRPRGRPPATKVNTTKLDAADMTQTSKAASDIVMDNFPTPPLSDVSTAPLEHRPQPDPNTASAPEPPTGVEPEPPTTPPKNKKILQFNPKTGTLGSPPKPKKQDTPSRLVTVHYGQDEASRKKLGDKIAQILAGELQLPKTPMKQFAARGSSTRSNASKTTHPFFAGKSAKKSPSTSEDVNSVYHKAPPARHSIFMSTPVSPRKPRARPASDNIPQFGMKSYGTKVPGAMQPLWPPRGMSHIRGFDLPAQNINSTERKSKGSVVTVLPQESVLSHLVRNLDLKSIRYTLPRDDDKFTPAPKELRLPGRHFESGRKLQHRIRSQLRTYRSEAGRPDEPSSQKRRNHAAIQQLYDSLETRLSAYDRSTCETQAWTQKYAPVAASEVLQAGKEGLLLKEWLGALQIHLIDTGGNDGNGSKSKSKPGSPRKRRKKNKLDDFIVDSDEEANEMDEVSEDEHEWAPAGPGSLKKTVIRSGDIAAKSHKGQGRLTNAAVISGPHGSGKSAAVYAVAKELGFEVFEINSSTRRSGKDILEKVGDMTRNHLVQHQRVEQAPEDDVEDEVARDLQSGKQGMMTAFFKPKPAGTKPKTSEQTSEETANITKRSSTKTQKQSLILLEEVDILYEEDKQFWASLMGMITQSKRPFIMTCNDETLVPLQTLNLHGIFRFSPPPADLAIDLCLLIAANEGHALQRSAVQSLYASRDHDLRAAITELNYWCQIGVGDRKGGFDWFYLRWPKGSDLDANGDVVRVISEDTYRKGMGWIGRDMIATASNPMDAEEEAMHQSWDSWRMDMGDWHTIVDMASWATSLPDAMSTGKARTDMITAYENFCDTMSDADVYSSGSFGLKYEELLDPTLPEMPTKIKDDFIIGRNLLEADPRASACSPHKAISTSLKSLARHQLLQTTLAPKASPLTPVTEDKAITMLETFFQSLPYSMTRMDIAIAFDPIAVSEKAAPSAHLDPSVFDRTLKLIVLDVAPWLRGIVTYDHQLMLERRKLGNLLSEGGKRKRMRTTRSAYSAMQGGERRSTRRERYFGDSLNMGFVMRTGGHKWQDAITDPAKDREASIASSIPSSPPSDGSVEEEAREQRI